MNYTLLSCPEFGCDNQNSLTAPHCAKCGANIDKSLTDNYELDTLLIPEWPIDYWKQWHISYWTGNHGAEIEYSDKGKLKKGHQLLSYSGISVPSPFNAIQVGFEYVADKIDVGSYSRSRGRFLEVLVERGQFDEQIGHIYENLYVYLHDVARKAHPKSWRRFFGPLGGLDPKEIHSSYEDLVQRINDLKDVRAVRGRKYRRG